MAITIITNLDRSSIHLHEMEPIKILVTGEDSCINFCLRYGEQGPEIIKEIYYPDFSGLVAVDIRDIVSGYMHVLLPEDMDSDFLQTSLVHNFHLEIGDTHAAVFSVLGFSEDAKSRMTDIDTLRVPKDYIIPLSTPQTVKRSAIGFYSAGGKIATMTAGCVSSGQGGPPVNRFMRLPTPDRYSRLQAFLANNDNTPLFKGPVLEICNGEFEQYLFANRYGGFDNIPMDGTREFLPDITISHATSNGISHHISTEQDYVYSQHTGYLSARTIEALSELIGGSQIYHWDSRHALWREIIVLEADISPRSTNHLHSCSFKYKYSDGSRPQSLK